MRRTFRDVLQLQQMLQDPACLLIGSHLLLLLLLRLLVRREESDGANELRGTRDESIVRFQQHRALMNKDEAAERDPSGAPERTTEP